MTRYYMGKAVKSPTDLANTRLEPVVLPPMSQELSAYAQLVRQTNDQADRDRLRLLQLRRHVREVLPSKMLAHMLAFAIREADKAVFGLEDGAPIDQGANLQNTLDAYLDALLTEFGELAALRASLRPGKEAYLLSDLDVVSRLFPPVDTTPQKAKSQRLAHAGLSVQNPTDKELNDGMSSF